MNQKMLRLLTEQRNVKIISSVKPGLGKTYKVEKDAQKKGQKVYHFPVGGNIDLERLG